MLANRHILAAEVQNLVLTSFRKTPMVVAVSGVGSRSDAPAAVVASRPIRRGRKVNPDLPMLLFTWALLIVDGRSTRLSGRQILLFQLKPDCCISISRCGSFIRERWIFIPMAPVKCGPSQLASAPWQRATAASIFVRLDQSGAEPRSRHDWNKRPCRGLQTLAAMFARLGRADQSFFAIGEIHKADKQMIATARSKPNPAVEVFSK